MTRHGLVLAAILAVAAAPAVAADAEHGATLTAPCGICHGAQGRSAMPNVPSLAGMPATYTTLQLILFRETLRNVQPMTALARDLSDGDIEDIAAHYERLPPGPPPGRGAADPAQMEQARRLAEAQHCNACHVGNFGGGQGVPRLAGQREDYLAHALREYRADTRRGADTQMNGIAGQLSDADIVSLARFLAHLD